MPVNARARRPLNRRPIFIHALSHGKESLKGKFLAIGFIAYANGLPLLLTASTMGVWLKELGLSYTAIGLFALAKLPSTFKFLWAPVLDQVSVPFLSRVLGQRRAWLLITQSLALLSLWGMTVFSPLTHLPYFVMCTALLNASASSQHALLMAYQVETMESRTWGSGEAMSVFGFRLGIMTAGAGALYMSTFFPWDDVYRLLSLIMVVGLGVVLWMDEPAVCRDTSSATFKQWFRSAVADVWRDFLSRVNWLWILLFMILYRLGDHLLSSMPTLFYLDLGFSKEEVAQVVKFFGMGATLLGSFLGGIWIRRYGYQNTLYWGALSHMLSNLLYIVQGMVGSVLPVLFVTSGIEHFTGGFMLTAFFATQLTCCNRKFAATQLALITALASSGHFFGAPSGWIVDHWGWNALFSLVVFAGIPGVLLIQKLQFNQR